ncbi:hypothetical protein [Sphingomonas sp. PAMC 26605]|uniref:hypothetical protein n=1 Tax=Sphingomonas sp. PAMC 26605 TaxID=1112214 RepID=UPI0012F4E0E6|nr:hypothetical protein [Sphingomonas sp. PAMC 26605]
MSESSLDRTIDGIDRHLSYLHKERWALEHAQLRDAARNATGEEQARAKQAVRDHYAERNHPETSRDPLVRQATMNYERRQ